MKAKNKLLTLLILSASAAVTTAAINKAIQVSAISKIFWLNQNHFVSNGVLAMFTIQKKELENRFYWFTTWILYHPVMSGNSSFRFSVMNTPFTLSTCWDLDVPRKRIWHTPIFCMCKWSPILLNLKSAIAPVSLPPVRLLLSHWWHVQIIQICLIRLWQLIHAVFWISAPFLVRLLKCTNVLLSFQSLVHFCIISQAAKKCSGRTCHKEIF